MGSVASAAAEPVSGVPFSSWSGFYAGINAGYGAGSENLKSSTDVTATNTGPFSQAHSNNLGLSGGLAGLQLGYNIQMQNWLAGIEADYQFGHQSGSSSASHAEFVLAPTVPSAMTDSETARIKSFGTLRGRIGRIEGDNLFYVTGGLAWGRRELNVTSTFFAFEPGPVQSGTASANFADTHAGWVLGGGIESRIFGNWTAKLEYLHLDLGNMTVAATGPVTSAAGATTGAIATTASSDFREHIVRAGLNYKFAGTAFDTAYAAAPAARPLASWTGLYAGINAGYGVGNESLNSSSRVTSATTGPFDQAQSGDLALRGGLAGLQLGYNIQLRNWLTGIEADYQFGRQRGSSAASHTEQIILPTQPSGMSDSETARIKSFGTLRGRLGWITERDSVWYATGGLAWGRRELSVVSNFSAVGPLPSQTGTAAASLSDSHAGWVLGGGVESRLFGNWTAKLEYLYLDLGNVAVAAASPVTDTTGATTGTIATSASSSFRDHIVRAGLSYKLN